MRPQPLLHLVKTVSPLMMLAWQADPNTVMATLHQAAQDVVSAQAQARSHRTRGLLYCQLGDWEQATEAYLLATDWAKIARDTVALGTALNGLGTVMLYRQRYTLARRCFREAVQALEHTKDHSQHALALHNLGVTYHFLGHFHAALNLLEKAAALRSDLWDSVGEAISLTWIGRVYCSEHQFAYALAAYEAAMELVSQKATLFEGRWFEAGLCCLMAKLAERCGHLDLAIEQYLDALKRVETFDVEWWLTILQALSQLHGQAGDPLMALYYRRQVLAIAQRAGALSNEGNVATMALSSWSNASEAATPTLAPALASHFAPTHPLSLYF